MGYTVCTFELPDGFRFTVRWRNIPFRRGWAWSRFKTN